MPDFDKIVVRVPNWLGDCVISLPALDLLRALYPDGELSVLAKPHVAPLYIRDDIDIIIYDSKGAHKGLKGRMKLASELKERGFDCSRLISKCF